MTYFTHIHHTFPILHQQSFVNMYIEAMEARSSNKGYGNHPFLSCLFAVFACASTMKAKTAKSEAPSPTYVSDFLATSDGLALTKAFMEIKQPKLRRRIVDLVEEIAGRED